MNTTDFAPQPAVRRTRAHWSTELVGAGAAVVCALVLWTTLVLLGGLDLAVDTGGTIRQIGAADVALAAFGAGLIGLLGLRLLERFTPKARTIWTVIAVAVLIASYAGVLAATGTAAMWALVGLHTLVGVVIIAVGVRSRR